MGGTTPPLEYAKCEELFYFFSSPYPLFPVSGTNLERRLEVKLRD